VSERWLTYDEMVSLMGLTRGSAKVLARTKRWPRRPGNDGRARISVPEEEIQARRAPERTRARPPGNHPGSPPGRPCGNAPGNDGESDSPDLAQGVMELKVLCARLEAQVEMLRAREAEREDQAQKEHLGLERLLEEVRREREDLKTDRDAWRGQAERLALAPPRRPWWPWRRSA